jgi:hypothetical protein
MGKAGSHDHEHIRSLYRLIGLGFGRVILSSFELSRQSVLVSCVARCMRLKINIAAGVFGGALLIRFSRIHPHFPDFVAF